MADPDYRESLSNKSGLWVFAASARWLAGSAKRSGFSVTAFDQFGDADLAHDCFEVLPFHTAGELVAWVEANDFSSDFLIGGGLEANWSAYQTLAETSGWKNSSPGSIELARAPPFWSAVLREAGFSVAAIQILPVPPKKESIRWVRKPFFSTGGDGVSWFDNSRESTESSEFFLQEFVHGQPMSSLHVCDGLKTKTLGVFLQLIGHHGCGVARQAEFWADAFGAVPFSFAGAIGPLSLSYLARNRIQLTTITSVANVIARETGLKGIFGVDWVQEPSGNLIPIEINPRFTATCELWEMATGGNAVSIHLKAVAGRSSTLEKPLRTIAKTTIFRCGGEFLVTESMHRDLLAFWRDGILADIPAIGQSIECGSPIATVFSDRHSDVPVANDVERVFRSLKFNAEKLFAAISQSN